MLQRLAINISNSLQRAEKFISGAKEYLPAQWGEYL